MNSRHYGHVYDCVHAYARGCGHDRVYCRDYDRDYDSQSYFLSSLHLKNIEVRGKLIADGFEI